MVRVGHCCFYMFLKLLPQSRQSLIQKALLSIRRAMNIFPQSLVLCFTMYKPHQQRYRSQYGLVQCFTGLVEGARIFLPSFCIYQVPGPLQLSIVLLHIRLKSMLFLLYSQNNGYRRLLIIIVSGRNASSFIPVSNLSPARPLCMAAER